MTVISQRLRAVAVTALVLVGANRALADCPANDLGGDWTLYATWVSGSGTAMVRCAVNISLAAESPTFYSMNGTCKVDRLSSRKPGDLLIGAGGTLKEYKPTCKLGGTFDIGDPQIMIPVPIEILDARIESNGSATMKSHIVGIGRLKQQPSTDALWHFSLVR